MSCSSTCCPGRASYVPFSLTAGQPLVGSRSCCANSPSGLQETPPPPHTISIPAQDCPLGRRLPTNRRRLMIVHEHRTAGQVSCLLLTNAKLQMGVALDDSTLSRLWCMFSMSLCAFWGRGVGQRDPPPPPPKIARTQYGCSWSVAVAGHTSAPHPHRVRRPSLLRCFSTRCPPSLPRGLDEVPALSESPLHLHLPLCHHDPLCLG